MGILPLVFKDGESRHTLGLTGEELYTIAGVADAAKPGSTVTVVAKSADGTEKRFEALVRIDTPDEAEYFRHGGILQYVLRQLKAGIALISRMPSLPKGLCAKAHCALRRLGLREISAIRCAA